MKRYITVQNIIFLFSTTISGIILTFILLSNIAPFGISLTYANEGKDSNYVMVGPKDRVQIIDNNGEKITKQLSDLVYFSTKMPFHFDEASVKIIFKNTDPNQSLLLGFQDQENWHYDSKVVDEPLLNSLNWYSTGSNPTLYERRDKFSNVSQFLNNIPTDSIIGTYGLDNNPFFASKTRIPNYKPSSTDTVIDTPLRGRHTLYLYLQNEPFRMIIQKQDLNFTEGEDSAVVNVYKDNDLVYTANFDDDGIIDDSHKVLPPQEITIKNPGPGLPENGVYKVVIDVGGDSMIKSIRTNLHKIVFDGQIFPVSSATVYSKEVSQSKSNELFTNAPLITASTYHLQSLQIIQVGDQTLKIKDVNDPVSTVSAFPVTKITIPKSDVELKGLFGYFSFSPNQFFEPSHYMILPISRRDQIDAVDYILANYTPTKQLADGWKEADMTFNLSSAVVKDGTLSWLIKAPGLKVNNRSILIKNIKVTLRKKPLLSIR